jgi:hypothetical protein
MQKKTVSYCQGLLSSKTWENMYLHDVKVFSMTF